MIHSRRQLLTGLVLACSLRRAEAQERMRRVAVLNGVIQHDEGEALVALFRETLAKHGWRVGRNLAFEVRWSTASAESTRTAAEELLVWKPDVILARNTISVEKLLELKAELPIVFVSVFDPFGSGFLSEVTRPGKNITGFTTHDYGMAVKWVEFLKLVAPQVTRAALLFNPETAPYAQRFYDNLFTKAAQQIGVEASERELTFRPGCRASSRLQPAFRLGRPFPTMASSAACGRARRCKMLPATSETVWRAKSPRWLSVGSLSCSTCPAPRSSNSPR